MNIWIFNHYAVGPNSNGITRHFDLAKELVKLGHRVTIFASSFNHQKRLEEKEYKRKELFKKEVYNNVNFYWIKTTPYKKNDIKRIKNMLSYTVRAFFTVKKVEETPDIVIGSLMHPLAALLGYYVANKYKAKFYFEERDLWPQSLIDLGKVSPQNPLVKILSKLELFLYKKADKIIVLFDKAPNYVVSRGIDSKKVIYLPNGISLERYKSNNGNLPEELQKVFANYQDKFLIVYTGAHSLANYLEAVLDIALMVQKRTNNIQFLLIGDGPAKNLLIKKATMEGIKNVKFLPPVEKEYIPSLLKRADAGIIALKNLEVYKWGISLNKMYDYMAAGLPIIMFTSLKNNVVSDNGLGIVSECKETIVNKIIELSENREMAKEIGQKGYNYVIKYHTWEELSKKLSCEMTKDFFN